MYFSVRSVFLLLLCSFTVCASILLSVDIALDLLKHTGVQSRQMFFISLFFNNGQYIVIIHAVFHTELSKFVSVKNESVSFHYEIPISVVSVRNRRDHNVVRW